jgi:hypothetical protein
MANSLLIKFPCMPGSLNNHQSHRLPSINLDLVLSNSNLVLPPPLSPFPPTPFHPLPLPTPPRETPPPPLALLAPPLGTRLPPPDHVSPSLLLVPPPQLLLLPINLMNASLIPYEALPYSHGVTSLAHPCENPANSWVVLISCSIKCTSLLPPSQLWLFMLSFNATIMKHRVLHLQLGLISYPAYLV